MNCWIVQATRLLFSSPSPSPSKTCRQLIFRNVPKFIDSHLMVARYCGATHASSLPHHKLRRCAHHANRFSLPTAPPLLSTLSNAPRRRPCSFSGRQRRLKLNSIEPGSTATPQTSELSEVLRLALPGTLQRISPVFVHWYRKQFLSTMASHVLTKHRRHQRIRLEIFPFPVSICSYHTISMGVDK
jgi:hypothetical protein